MEKSPQSPPQMDHQTASPTSHHTFTPVKKNYFHRLAHNKKFRIGVAVFLAIVVVQISTGQKLISFNLGNLTPGSWLNISVGTFHYNFGPTSRSSTGSPFEVHEFDDSDKSIKQGSSAEGKSEDRWELSSTKTHDYNKYVWHKELLPGWHPSQNRRIIAIGDVHGMLHSLKKLLKRVDYDPKSDTVVLIGDVAAKHPSIHESLKTIRYCREHSFQAVRGNHDQYIIIWRNWMEHHRKDFVREVALEEYLADEEATLEYDDWLSADAPSEELKKTLPEGMKWKTQHFEIARRLPKSDFRWMMACSLTLYLHPIRTYFVHAGLFPWKLPGESHSRDPTSILSLKENKEPYTMLEMRNVKAGRKATKSKNKGHPWYSMWNEVMTVYDQFSEKNDEKPRDAFSVVYGHWAAKGLKIKPWSIGLDSGCVYGRGLSALVIGQDRTEDPQHHKRGKSDKYLVRIRDVDATVVKITCPSP